MKFSEQINNLKVYTDKTPRVFMKWDNTEAGRDVNECYERVSHSAVMYINQNNKAQILMIGEYFDTLEEIFHSAEEMYDSTPAIEEGLKYVVKDEFDMDYLKIVKELNAELFENNGDTSEYFFYTTNGYSHEIGFGEVSLWNSEVDGREFSHDKNEFEPMKPFLKQELNFYGKRLIKFSKNN